MYRVFLIYCFNQLFYFPEGLRYWRSCARRHTHGRASEPIKVSRAHETVELPPAPPSSHLAPCVGGLDLSAQLHFSSDTLSAKVRRSVISVYSGSPCLSPKRPPLQLVTRVPSETSHAPDHTILHAGGCSRDFCVTLKTDGPLGSSSTHR